jgi:MFS family permease
MLSRRYRIISIYSFGWIARAVGMIPIVLAPLAAYFERHEMALGLTMLGVCIFHLLRGIGMIGNNPVLSNLSSGPDRGSYMTLIQIINSAALMVSGFAVAIILGRNPPLFLYSIIFSVGIIFGVISGVLIRKVPEPPTEEQSERISFAGMFKEAFSQQSIRLFLMILLIVVLVSGVSRTFLVVYAREVFNQDDGMVLMYSVVGGLGNLLVGLLIRFLVDRIGAKPIFIICVILSLVTLIPIVFFPMTAVGNITLAIIFLSFLFFMLTFGFMGCEGIAQTYFMGLVPPEKMIDMGMLYFFIFGVAGAGGSFLAGLLLDLFAGLGFSPIMSFKMLYAMVAVLTAIALLLQRKLTPLGALPLAGAVKVLFSFRDLQAISLLDRLNKTQDSRQEQLLLGALYNMPSQLSIKNLLQRARSPRLATRMESIRALERMEALSEDAEDALIEDTINNPFTTAYVSARILGNHSCISAIPLLRELASSSDYMLAGESMIALAKMRDTAFRPQAERIILGTENPRLKIMGVESLGIYGIPESLYALVDILRGADPPPYLRDEVVLAMASIVNTQNQFYRILVRFLAEPSLSPTLAMDEAEAAFEYFNICLGGRKGGRIRQELPLLQKQVASIQSSVLALVQDKDGSLLSRWIMELPDYPFTSEPSFGVAQSVFSEFLLDSDIWSHRRMQLLITHWSAYQIRTWTKRLKR